MQQSKTIELLHMRTTNTKGVSRAVVKDALRGIDPDVINEKTAEDMENAGVFLTSKRRNDLKSKSE